MSFLADLEFSVDLLPDFSSKEGSIVWHAPAAFCTEPFLLLSFLASPFLDSLERGIDLDVTTCVTLLEKNFSSRFERNQQGIAS